MRWLIDEGIPKIVIDYLKEMGNDVFDVAEKMRGSDDLRLWKFAGKEKRIILTRDLGFVFPRSLPLPAGLVLLRIPDTCSKNTVLHFVRKAFESIEPKNLLNKITVIEPAKIRQRLLSGISWSG